MGKLIGTRSWGGVVGIRGSLPFVDGADLRKPEFASYSSEESKWIIEGEGVSPDIYIENDPAKEYAGIDEQLNKAIEVILEELKNYKPLPAIPVAPDNPMLNNKKIVVVFPAYNAAKTLEDTYREIPFDIVDEVVIVDDASMDDTIEVAHRIGIQHIIQHPENKGYGGNQKTCYRKALELGADIIIMVHPDYQYTPKLIPSIAHLMANDLFPAVLGSRILGKGALKGGMPVYKYLFNRLLTLAQNIMINQKLSEYHTGYRAFSREVLETINFEANSDDFVFDNQVLTQVFYHGFEIAEITCPTKYFTEGSSINFRRSTIYGLGVLKTSVYYFLQKLGIARFRIYDKAKNA
jgi:glycosyltransferase involved in cell wall biosynthesis